MKHKTFQQSERSDQTLKYSEHYERMRRNDRMILTQIIKFISHQHTAVTEKVPCDCYIMYDVIKGRFPSRMNFFLLRPTLIILFFLDSSADFIHWLSDCLVETQTDGFTMFVRSKPQCYYKYVQMIQRKNNKKIICETATRWWLHWKMTSAL